MKSRAVIEQIDTMLAHLKLTLKCCSAYEDLKDLRYDAANETVVCTFLGGILPDGKRDTWRLDINVACDSKASIIHDVEQRLYSFFV